MAAHVFENTEDPYRFIVKGRFGIDIHAVAAAGDANEITHVQCLIDGRPRSTR